MTIGRIINMRPFIKKIRIGHVSGHGTCASRIPPCQVWPGPQEGLGQGGPRLKWAKGRFGSKNDEKVKVLRMEFSIVENLSGLQASILTYLEAPKSILLKNQKI